MAKTASFNMRLEAEVKAQAEAVFTAFGITLADAVNMFLRQSIMAGGLPFELRLPAAKKTASPAAEAPVSEPVIAATDARFLKWGDREPDAMRTFINEKGEQVTEAVYSIFGDGLIEDDEDEENDGEWEACGEDGEGDEDFEGKDAPAYKPAPEEEGVLKKFFAPLTAKSAQNKK